MIINNFTEKRVKNLKAQIVITEKNGFIKRRYGGRKRQPLFSAPSSTSGEILMRNEPREVQQPLRCFDSRHYHKFLRKKPLFIFLYFSRIFKIYGTECSFQSEIFGTWKMESCSFRSGTAQTYQSFSFSAGTKLVLNLACRENRKLICSSDPKREQAIEYDSNQTLCGMRHAFYFGKCRGCHRPGVTGCWTSQTSTIAVHRKDGRKLGWLGWDLNQGHQFGMQTTATASSDCDIILPLRNRTFFKNVWQRQWIRSASISP